MSFDELLVIVRGCGRNSNAIAGFVREIKVARNAHGDSLLHILAAEGDDCGVATLLKVGCDVNVRNNFGSTPIECAAWREEYSVVCQLIDAGADVTIADSTGFTVVENLKMLGKNDMIELISLRLRERSNNNGVTD
jgi:ankyrin repeat protein